MRATGGANWNVTAVSDLTGRVIERYWYSPYGQLEAVVAAHPFDYGERSERPGVADQGGRSSEQGCERQTAGPARRTRTWLFAGGGDDGDVDADDYAVSTNGTCSGSAAGDCRRLDANADGVVNSTDQTIIAAYIATLDSDTELQRIPASAHSRRGNPFGHQGLVLDAELASYQNRARQYSPKAKRFMQKDPLMANAQAGGGYQDGPNLYGYLRNAPFKLTDPEGLTGGCCGPCAGVAALPAPPAATCNDDAGWNDSLVKCTGCSGDCNCSCPGTGSGATGGCKAKCKICWKCVKANGVWSWTIAPQKCGPCD
jgi:RHS repeat-associated protein